MALLPDLKLMIFYLDKLSGTLDGKRKKAKIKNLLHKMSKKDNTIYNKRIGAKSIWKLSEM